MGLFSSRKTGRDGIYIKEERKYQKGRQYSFGTVES